MTIKSLRALSLGAVHGPWWVTEGTVVGPDGDTVAVVFGNLGINPDRGITDVDNADLIAAARNALPALLAVAEALRFHNRTPSGSTRKCLPECIACAALAALEATT